MRPVADPTPRGESTELTCRPGYIYILVILRFPNLTSVGFLVGPDAS